MVWIHFSIKQSVVNAIFFAFPSFMVTTKIGNAQAGTVGVTIPTQQAMFLIVPSEKHFVKGQNCILV